MDIATRLKIFMNDRNITNSQFADACNISRPTLSQLLTGRNKKVNNEIISKIHRAYPSLSIMWLMFGEPPMMLNGENSNVSYGHYESSIASHGGDESDYVQREEKSIKSDNKIVFGSDLMSESEDKTDDDLEYALRNIMKNNYESMSIRRNDTESKNGKHIVSVMVLYSDNSFESFIPNK